MYVLFNAKLSAWVTKSMTYTSNVNDALRLSREDAIAHAALRVEDGQLTWIPVSCLDIAEVRQ